MVTGTSSAALASFTRSLNRRSGQRALSGYSLTAGSTYSIGSDGLGTMSFNTESFGTFNFQISVSNLGNGTLIQNNADPNTRGSGVFYVQTPSQYVVPNGGYAGGAFGGQTKPSTGTPKRAPSRRVARATSREE